MKTTQLENALEEMGYEIADSDFGMEFPVSIPCGLECDTPATFTDIDGFEAELEKKNMGTLDGHTVNNDGGWFVDCDIYIKENYKRVKAKVWENSVRLYPREDGPTLGELAQITSAIETAFETQLSHEPIDQNHD